MVGIVGIFLLFKNLLMIDQYAFGAAPVFSNLAFIFAVFRCFAWIRALLLAWLKDCHKIF